MDDQNVAPEGTPENAGPTAEDIRDWAVLETLGTEQEAMLAVGFLNAAGIDAVVEAVSGEHQEFPVNFGELGEFHVRVPPEQVDEARRVLAEQLEASEAAAAAEAEDVAAGGAASGAGDTPGPSGEP